MHIVDIRESFVMLNPSTGHKCSPYGSIPPGYTDRVSQGWTFGMDDGTVGIGRPPLATYSEAVKVANDINTKAINSMIQHANIYPDQASSCLAKADRIPLFCETGRVIYNH